MSKKGILDLSITTVIVMILAIVVLGLLLVFTTKIFKEGEEDLEKATDIVDKQFIDQLKATGEKVAIDSPKVDIEAGEVRQVFIALNNKAAAPESFTITASCSRIGSDPSCTDVALEYKTDPTTLESGEVTVQPMNVNVGTGAAPGTYMWTVSVASTTTDNLELVVDVT